MFTIFILPTNRSHNLGRWIIPRYVDEEHPEIVTEWGPQEYTRDVWEHIVKHKVYRDEPVDEGYLCYGGKLSDNNTQVTEYTVCEVLKGGKLVVRLDPVPAKREPVPEPTPVVVVPQTELQQSESEEEEEEEIEVETEVDDDDEPEDELPTEPETTKEDDPDNVEEEFD